MNLYTLYVGQGNCSVLVGDNEAIIIDTYFCENDEDAQHLKTVLSRLLSGRKLVGLILTGFDRDHAHPKGVSIVINKYRPHWVMYPGYFKDSQAATDVFTVIRTAEASRRYTSSPLYSLSIRVDRHERVLPSDLSSEWNFETFSPHPHQMVSSNNSSLVVRVKPHWWRRGFSYLITGDTENERWIPMNKIYRNNLKSDVLSGPHHGSRKSMNQMTLELIDPHTVLVSAGIKNQYSHPRRITMNRYTEHGCEWYSTHGGDSWRTFLDDDDELVTELYLPYLVKARAGSLEATPNLSTSTQNLNPNKWSHQSYESRRQRYPVAV